jgi:hypothetical protein
LWRARSSATACGASACSCRARRLNRAALDYVVYAPLGWYLVHQAWRKNVSGIVPGPLPFFWGVTKTV